MRWEPIGMVRRQLAEGARHQQSRLEWCGRAAVSETPLNRLLATTLLGLVLLHGSRASAQTEFDGLDLTDDKKAEKPAEPAKAPAPAPAPARPAATAASPGAPELPLVERDITQEDRVKSVQRKLYIKRGRFELAPNFVLSVNDPLYTKLGFAVRAAFYPADTLAVTARFSLLQTLPTDDVRFAKRALQSRIFFSEPIWNASVGMEWSPFYGKVGIFNSILQFDPYLVGGAGIVYTGTSTQQDGSVQLKPSVDFGLGMRFVVRDWLAVNVALINTTYVDTPTGTTKGATQNLMMLNVGLSVFVPFKSTYREAE